MSFDQIRFLTTTGDTNKITQSNLLNVTSALESIGVVGNQGDSLTGSIGSQGATGTKGPMGPTGEVGLSGPIGSTGQIGDIGPVGPDTIGAQGAVGPTGPQGATGPIGPPGANVVGPAGPAGSTGPAGALGAGPSFTWLDLNDTPSTFAQPFNIVAVNGGATGVTDLLVNNTVTTSMTTDHSINSVGIAELGGVSSLPSGIQGGSDHLLLFGGNSKIDNAHYCFVGTSDVTSVITGKNIWAEFLGGLTSGSTGSYCTGNNSFISTVVNPKISTPGGAMIATRNGTIAGSFSSIIDGAFSSSGPQLSILQNSPYCSLLAVDGSVYIGQNSTSSFSSIITSTNVNLDGNNSAMIASYNTSITGDNSVMSSSSRTATIIGSGSVILPGRLTEINSDYCFISGNSHHFNGPNNIKISSTNAKYCSVIGCSELVDIQGKNYQGAIIGAENCNLYYSGSTDNQNMIITSLDCYSTGNYDTSIMGSRDCAIKASTNGKNLSILSSRRCEIIGTTPKYSSIIASYDSKIRYNSTYSCIIGSSRSYISDAMGNGNRSAIVCAYGSATYKAVNAGKNCVILSTPQNFLGKAFSIASTDTEKLLVSTIQYSGISMMLSDKRFKKDIEEVPTDPYLLDKIVNVKVHQFRFKEEHPDIPVHRGFIAQDVDSYFPQFVYQGKSNIKVYRESESDPWKIVNEYDEDDVLVDENETIEIDPNDKNIGYIYRKNSDDYMTIDGKFVSATIWRAIQRLAEKKKNIDLKINKLTSLIEQAERKFGIVV